MKMLIAEDDAVSRIVLQRALERLGHECRAASDGLEAWTLFQSDPPDVVISDWIMPGLEGPDLCRQVREHDGTGTYTYFILLTALEDKAHAIEGLEAGADDYLAKPLDRGELQLRLLVASRVTELHRRLAEREAELRRLAETDELTGLYNRRYALATITHLMHLASRQGQPLMLSIFDLDHFKQINDQYGHAMGDEVLRTLGALLRRAFRAHDVAARWGGEEFLLALFGSCAQDGCRRLEILLEDLKAHEFTTDDGVVFHVSFSAGVAELPTDGNDVETLIRAADEALYAAKAQGRARIAVARY
jgi:diguanylate cyclase (GGDEF)-like protein